MASSSEDRSSSTEDEKCKNDKDEIAPDDEDERMWAAISFVVILIIIGLPLWWKMTEVERSYFPYGEITELRHQNVTFPIYIFLSASEPTTTNAMENDLKNCFLTSTLFEAHFETILYSKEAHKKNIRELENDQNFHINKPGVLQLIETEFPLENDVVIGEYRTAYFKKGTGADIIYNFLQETVLREKILEESIKAVTHPGYTSDNLDFLRKMRPNPKYDVIFTVVIPQPETIKFEWNNEVILERFFRPLLNQLNFLSEFKIKSQWLYLVDLQQTPKKVDNHFELNQKQIPHIITPLEKKIGSGVAKNPCIHFVLYVTKCEHTPMMFANEYSIITNAVLSARWGGVQLVNPNTTHCVDRQPLRINSKKAMRTFIQQFKTLIGLDDLSLNQKVLKSDDGTKVFLWELDGLYRMRILEQFTSSRITLTSLSQLLGEISNIVITNEVGSAVLEAAYSAKETLYMLQKGHLVEALKLSTRSFISSEFAFTHPSLLALLYFPDDQKYAVYIPLYLPVMIPVLLSLKNIQNWLKKKLFSKETKTKGE